MKVALAGAGAFGVKHLEAIAKIDGVEVVSLVGRTLEATQEVARRFGVGHVTTEADLQGLTKLAENVGKLVAQREREARPLQPRGSR